jgi:hypothetical protein
MKKVLFPVVIALLVAGSCKNESQAPVSGAPSATSPAGSPAAPASGKAPENIADIETVRSLKSLLQGKWKSVAENGAVYDINGAVLTVYRGGQAGKPMDIEYSRQCGIPCGSLDKRYRNYTACVTFKGVDGFCMAVLSTSPNRLEFVRMGSIPQSPEVWTK